MFFKGLQKEKRTSVNVLLSFCKGFSQITFWEHLGNDPKMFVKGFTKITPREPLENIL